MKNQSIYVAVFARSSQQSNRADMDVPGLYEVIIQSDAICSASVADVAIESFHNAVPISSPEDFEVLLFDSLTRDVLTPTFAAVEHIFCCKRVGGVLPDWILAQVAA